MSLCRGAPHGSPTPPERSPSIPTKRRGLPRFTRLRVILAVLAVTMGTVAVPSATPAQAGVGAPTVGCNQFVVWYQDPGEVDYRLWTKNWVQNPGNTNWFMIQFALRSVYRAEGNECGNLAELTSMESRLSSGWLQYMAYGYIYLEDNNCNNSYVYVRAHTDPYGTYHPEYISTAGLLCGWY